jgi:excisionase family DNA binding protein
MAGPDVPDDKLTINQAAALLGVHPRTVRDRIKDGTYKAEKTTINGSSTYLLSRTSLTDALANNTRTRDLQQPVSDVNQAALHELITELVNLKHQDAERENRVEGGKLRVQGAQTQMLVSSGLIVAMGAILSQMPDPQNLGVLYFALINLLGSIVAALTHLNVVARNIEAPELVPHPRAAFWRLISFGGFALGLCTFMVFLNLNV